ncbi:uncharacterized protein MYCGRDRAFT_90823 [Zymoseptoria tritici IPO323]|uniref:Uncharacterized protein n=1 Tax=Zymoseptoria tritici (strain CBS 115943 / IPO323) TaxID=336722 RepID=F9X4F9_ZYMTI|nr:uncharacterized protein MYCGRDRAFT_90823 [Zymoseptoria tritici IPO323]EGP89957.1 hypothetical protein MYCGRDRAFT_90823 [Zymoseptoria tritici IPO323]
MSECMPLWSALDVLIRSALIALSAASFLPQLSRVIVRGNLTGISSGKIIIDQLVATCSLAMVIVAMFGYPLGDDPLSAAQRLDIAQFAVLLGLFALYLQVKILKQRRSPGSLSINGLLTQTFVIFVVGVSMVFRVKVPAQRPLRLLEWLLLWYAMVGFATLNSLIFAFSQGALWWHARRQFVEAEVRECEALLQQIE